MQLTFFEIASCLGIQLPSGINPRDMVSNISLDSKKESSNSLFVCIKGNNADGHDFVEEAIENGAVLILSQKPLENLSSPVFVVENTVCALGKLASYWREKTGAIVIGITGTAGKTTLKEVLANILSQHGKTAKSRLNHNNQIGLPQSILETEGDEDFWIMEVGISHRGDMDELGNILKPDLGVILNVGPGHIEGLGEKGVAWNKARLLNYLKPGGKAIINADYPDLLEEARKYAVDIIQFSSNPESAGQSWRVARIDETGDICELSLNGSKLSVSMKLSGRAGAENVIAAATCAAVLGLDVQEIRSGCASAVLPKQRFNEQQFGSWHIIDDTYNANPLSMQRILEASEARARSHDLPLVTVLGEMGELGPESACLHEALGEILAAHKPEIAFFKGNYFNDLKNGYESADKNNRGNLYHVNDAHDFSNAMKQWLFNESKAPGGGVVLFKGSRANRLEDFVRIFKELIG